MDLNRIITLARKLHRKYNGENVTETYTLLKGNTFIKDIMTDAKDLVYLIFTIHLLNKGYSVENISNLLNGLFSFEVIEVIENDPYVDCEVCDGDGEEICSYCGGDGESQCDDCDGVGVINQYEEDEYDCDTCNGGGYLSCDICDESGKIECHDCEGSGEMTKSGEQSITISYILSVDNKLKGSLEYTDTPFKISEIFYQKITGSDLSLICSIRDNINDDYIGFEPGEYVVDYFDLKPKIKYFTGGRLGFD